MSGYRLVTAGADHQSETLAEFVQRTTEASDVPFTVADPTALAAITEIVDYVEAMPTQVLDAA
jgi:hypothetical protein